MGYGKHGIHFRRRPIAIFILFPDFIYNSQIIFFAPTRNLCVLGKKFEIFKCAPDNLKAALALEIRFNAPRILSRSATKSKQESGGTTVSRGHYIKRVTITHLGYNHPIG